MRSDRIEVTHKLFVHKEFPTLFMLATIICEEFVISEQFHSDNNENEFILTDKRTIGSFMDMVSNLDWEEV